MKKAIMLSLIVTALVAGCGQSTVKVTFEGDWKVNPNSLKNYDEYWLIVSEAIETMSFYEGAFYEIIETMPSEVFTDKEKTKIHELRLAYDEKVLIHKKAMKYPETKEINYFHRKLILTMETAVGAYGIADYDNSQSTEERKQKIQKAQECMDQVSQKLEELKNHLGNTK